MERTPSSPDPSLNYISNVSLHGHISVSRSLSSPPMSGSINEVWSVQILIEKCSLCLSNFPVSSIFAEPSSLLNWATITHQFLCGLLNGLHIVAFSCYLCIFNKLLHAATLISSFHYLSLCARRLTFLSFLSTWHLGNFPLAFSLSSVTKQSLCRCTGSLI